MKQTRLLILLALLLLPGCSCKEAYMDPIDIVQPQDKQLNCQGLLLSMNEMRALLQNVHVRCKRPHLFSPYPPCTPWVKQDAARNYHVINDRIAYLKLLYTTQKCDTSLISEGDTLEPNESNCCASIGLPPAPESSYTIPSN